MALIEGKAYWASVTTPNTTFEPIYSVDLVVDDELASKFEAEGHRVKDLSVKDPSGMPVSVGRAITIKRKVNGPNGMIRRAPKLYNSNKEIIDDMIGNGSTVKVQYNEYDWTWQGKAGKGLDFKAMQVLDLVQVSSADGSEIDPFGDGEEF
jgi:hypothetical protein